MEIEKNMTSSSVLSMLFVLASSHALGQYDIGTTGIGYFNSPSFNYILSILIFLFHIN